MGQEYLNVVLGFKLSISAIIYAHFGGDGQFSPDTLRQLEALAPHFKVRIFVSNSIVLDIKAARDLGFHTMQRENIGYDFGAWQAGYYALDDSNITSFYFMNDSCLGPLPGFEDDIEVLKSRSEDLVGLVASSEVTQHVQSFFFGLQNDAVRSGFVDRFWSGLAIPQKKREIVLTCEIGLSRLAMLNGLRLFALNSPPVMSMREKWRLLRSSKRRASWQTTFLVLKQLARTGTVNPMYLDQSNLFPIRNTLIKRNAITSNPYRCDVHAYISQVERICPETAATMRTLVRQSAR